MNRQKHLLTLLDHDEQQVRDWLDLAMKMKRGQVKKRLDEKTLGMLFQKNSTRTRISFEAGVTRL
ncbi:MAG: ornithine carbamoyltransferase, partial [Candidatus Micrarchaeota archaeon]